MANFMFTFEPTSTQRIISKTEDSECFYQVVAVNYPNAVKKILKLKLPNISSEEDLVLTSVQEESAMEIINGGNDDAEVTD